MKIYPVFHITLFHRHSNTPFSVQINGPPPLIIINDQEEFEAEAILNVKHVNNQRLYLVKWSGGDFLENMEFEIEVETSITSASKDCSEFSSTECLFLFKLLLFVSHRWSKASKHRMFDLIIDNLTILTFNPSNYLNYPNHW